MSFKVLLLDGVDPICAHTFKERGIQADQPNKLSPEELIAVIGEYDGMVVRSATTVTADLLKHAKSMKVIGRAGVGVDNIDIKAATSKGVLIMNRSEERRVGT